MQGDISPNYQLYNQTIEHNYKLRNSVIFTTNSPHLIITLHPTGYNSHQSPNHYTRSDTTTITADRYKHNTTIIQKY